MGEEVELAEVAAAMAATGAGEGDEDEFEGEDMLPLLELGRLGRATMAPTVGAVQAAAEPDSDSGGLLEGLGFD